MSENSRVCDNEARSSYAGVTVGSSLVMKGQAIIENNIATNLVNATGSTYLRGGGAYVSGSAVLRDSAVIRGNICKGDGGGVYLSAGASLVISNSASIYRNTSTANSGGGICMAAGTGWISLNGGSVSGNQATSGGGIYLAAGTTLTTSNAVSICGNKATFYGGGIYMATGNGWLSLNGGSVSSNMANHAGGIYFSGTNGWITGTTIEGNTLFDGVHTDGIGGGCFIGAAASRLYFDGVRLAGNKAGAYSGYGGGAIRVAPGAVVCSNCVFSGNSAVGYGGAVDFYNTTSNSVFSVCVFSNNVSGTAGGAVRSVNPLLFEDCVFAANVCTNANENAGFGGAVYLDQSSVSAQLTARRCLFAGNVSSNSYGGAICFLEISSLTQRVENCTFFGNVAKYGAAVYANRPTTGDILLDFCTVRGNTNLNSSSAAIVQGTLGSTVSLSGTVVAYNYYGSTITDVSGTLKAADHCYFTQASNTVTITSAADNLYLATSGDPKLADAPADNGGTLLPDGTRMLTLAFAKASPLREAGGDATGIETDQRGQDWPRVVGTLADIGAFEFNPGPPTCTSIVVR